MQLLSVRILFSLLLLPGVALFATDAEDRAVFIRDHYSKFEARIPARDGTHLYTTIYTPNWEGGPWPIIMIRTPYSAGPYGADKYKAWLGPNPELEKDGYIFVFQDVRGRYMSEGKFRNMTPHKSDLKTNESTDTYDTIDWLVKNLPNNNNKVAQWGVSYPGFYTAAGMIDSHPSLVLASPQAPIADWFWDDMHHNGAFCLNLAFNFFSSFGVARPEPTTERVERFEHGTPDGYQFFMDLGPLSNVNKNYFNGEIDFWNQFIEHPNYDDFWQSRNILPHLRNVNCAVLTVVGHYDAEDLYGPWNIYKEVEKNNKQTNNRVVVGPWSHGAWVRRDGDRLGDSYFGQKSGPWYNEHVLTPTFRHHLKGGPAPKLPEALIFETGANRWRQFDQWPPKGIETRDLYLAAADGLSWEKPTTKTGYSEFVSDPGNPVPNTATIGTSWGRDFMAEDQRFASRRPDVLVFQSEVLTEDVTIAGPIDVDLWVSTDKTAADWIVKVVDVYPGGEPALKLPGEMDEDGEQKEIERGHAQILIRYEAIRGRFRNSFEKPEPFEPGKPTKVSLRLMDVLHNFQRGHRIMIQVQSSFFPFIDRNPQNYVDNIFKAEEKDFTKATHRVYFDKKHPSKLRVGILTDKF
ncbi:MAG: CocE/NonD family hydrolase [Acidobacteriota bacterium]|nr:CocE/NonD family hydrolase [Acidobacteriota bacterium]